ncbi:hypothetical protein [Leptolyngbya phage Lbo-JY46]
MKTNETSNVIEHNLRVPSYENNKEKEFPETRQKAMSWWNDLSLEEKFYKVIPWLKKQNLGASDRHPSSLTGREIEQIWLKETTDLIAESVYKPNQKQFKTFNESLFKAYIDKFSDADLYKAHNILTALRLERSK